jgi:hypothetical protein
MINLKQKTWGGYGILIGVFHQTKIGDENAHLMLRRAAERRTRYSMLQKE